MYSFTFRNFVKYLRANNYNPEVLDHKIFINEWFITVEEIQEYITISHPKVFPASYSFPFCDFDKAIRKLHAFIPIAQKLHTMHAYKPLRY